MFSKIFKHPRWKYASCAHKRMLYKISDNLGKVKQAMQEGCCPCPLHYILPWFNAQLANGFEHDLWRHRHFGPKFDKKLSFWPTMIQCELICVEPSLGWLQNCKYS